jgi:hypothetical protein
MISPASFWSSSNERRGSSSDRESLYGTRKEKTSRGPNNQVRVSVAGIQMIAPHVSPIMAWLGLHAIGEAHERWPGCGDVCVLNAPLMPGSAAGNWGWGLL